MFRKIFINSAFSILQSYLIAKITVAPLKLYFEGLITPAKQVADLLTDANPNDTTQLLDWWRTNQSALLSTGGIEAAIAIIQREVKDETIRDLLISMLADVLEKQNAPSQPQN